MYSVKEQSHNDFEQTVEYGDSTDLLSNTIASVAKEKMTGFETNFTW